MAGRDARPTIILLISKPNPSANLNSQPHNLKPKT